MASLELLIADASNLQAAHNAISALYASYVRQGVSQEQLEELSQIGRWLRGSIEENHNMIVAEREEQGIEEVDDLEEDESDDIIFI